MFSPNQHVTITTCSPQITYLPPHPLSSPHAILPLLTDSTLFCNADPNAKRTARQRHHAPDCQQPRGEQTVHVRNPLPTCARNGETSHFPPMLPASRGRETGEGRGEVGVGGWGGRVVGGGGGGGGRGWGMDLSACGTADRQGVLTSG